MQEVIYIIGKYTDKTPERQQKNVNKATRKSAELCKEGYCIITPHTNFKLHEETIGYYKVMLECYELIRRSDKVYVLNNWKTSKGSKIEVQWARNLKKKIIYEGKSG